MTDTTGSLPPAGWYPDPYGAPFARWWDGAGWTEHTNAPVAPVAEVAPVAPVVTPEPVAYTPEPAPYVEPYVEPAAYSPEPAAYTPPGFEPVAYTPPVVEPAVYTPPVLEEPPAAASDPFAGFVSPTDPAQSTWPPQAAAFEPTPVIPAQEPAPYELFASKEPETFQPAAYTPPTQGYEPAPAVEQRPAPQEGVFGTDLFGQSAQPAAQPTPAAAHNGPNAPTAFDFGFGSIISGDPSAPNESGAGDEGLFGSWSPDEYVEPPRNGFATAGLTLGILSFFLSALTGVPGMILSALGIGRAGTFARQGSGPVGRGKAVTGLVLSIVGSAATVALILYGLPTLTGLLNGAVTDAGSDDSAPVDEVDLTQNGGFPLEIGDTGSITLADSDAAAIQFTVTAITPNFTCTAPEAVSPDNGQFIAVTMAFTLSADYLGRMDAATPLHMNQSDWIGFVADENGTQVDNTDTGSSCIAEAEQFPAEFAAGTDVSGTIVLDMQTDVASLSWAPTGVTDLDPGMTRWEWTVPA